MNMTIARITARGLFGRRRFLLLFPLGILVVGLALLSDLLGASPRDWAEPVLIALGLVVVLPITALIVGTGVLGSEIDDGTVVHIVTKPLARREIIFAKLLVGTVVTALASGIPLFFAGALAGGVRLGLGLVVGCAVGSLAYNALFLALSLVTHRPVLIGLAYVLIWEGLISNFVTGTRVLSIQQYALSIADRVADSPLLYNTVAVPVSWVMSAVFAIGFTLLAIDRLRSFSVAGETS